MVIAECKIPLIHGLRHENIQLCHGLHHRISCTYAASDKKKTDVGKASLLPSQHLPPGKKWYGEEIEFLGLTI